MLAFVFAQLGCAFAPGIGQQSSDRFGFRVDLALAAHLEDAGRYLASFAWRYNRRYQLQTMIPRFVHSAARTQPMPYRLLIAG